MVMKTSPHFLNWGCEHEVQHPEGVEHSYAAALHTGELIGQAGTIVVVAATASKRAITQREYLLICIIKIYRIKIEDRNL